MLQRKKDGSLSVNAKLKIFDRIGIGLGLTLLFAILLYFLFRAPWTWLAIGILALLHAMHAIALYFMTGYVPTRGAWAHGKWSWILLVFVLAAYLLLGFGALYVYFS